MHPLIDQGLTLALYGMSTVFFANSFSFCSDCNVPDQKKVKYIDENSSELGIR